VTGRVAVVLLRGGDEYAARAELRPEKRGNGAPAGVATRGLVAHAGNRLVLARRRMPSKHPDGQSSNHRPDGSSVGSGHLRQSPRAVWRVRDCWFGTKPSVRGNAQDAAVAYATRSSASRRSRPRVLSASPKSRRHPAPKCRCSFDAEVQARRGGDPDRPEGGNWSADLYPTIPFVTRTLTSTAIALATIRSPGAGSTAGATHDRFRAIAWRLLAGSYDLFATICDHACAVDESLLLVRPVTLVEPRKRALIVVAAPSGSGCVFSVPESVNDRNR
jgi:hypothetical protein